MSDSALDTRILSINPRVHKSFSGDTIWIYSGICKTLRTTRLERSGLTRDEDLVAPTRQLILQAEGQVGYQHFSRSGSVDALQLLQSRSNTATLELSLVYRERYPLRFSVRYNQSSPFQLDNPFEVSVGFDQNAYKQRLRDKLTARLKQATDLRQAATLRNYETAFRQLEQQRQFLQSSEFAEQTLRQRVSAGAGNRGSRMDVGDISAMQNRVDSLRGLRALANIPGLSGSSRISDEELNKRISLLEAQLTDSVQSSVRAWERAELAGLQQRRDSLQSLVIKFQDSLSAEKQRYAALLDSVNRELSALYSNSALQDYARTKGMADSLEEKRSRTWITQTSMRFGKFLLQHSALTVSDIFLYGAAIKYGDARFLQLSAGYYDFAFRELYRIRTDSTKRPRQSVLAIKLGKTDGKNYAAFNFYIGQKFKPGSTDGRLRTIAGVSAERTIHFSKNLQLDLELAKSTRQPTNLSQKQQGTLKDLFTGFNSNQLGATGSLKARLPKTQTDLEIGYRYWGSRFESFNASQYFNPQTQFQGRVMQPFFRRKLTVSLAQRYTDFRSYNVASNLRTAAWFTSANATLRLKRMPVISVGYFPGSQLYWMDGKSLYEYFFYVLNATASHQFQVGKLPMQVVATANKFLNRYSDSLVNGAQHYYNLFCSAWADRLTYQFNYAYQTVGMFDMSTMEAGITYAQKIFSLGGSLKANWMTRGFGLGYSTQASLRLARLGTLSLLAERSFLPGRDAQFIPVWSGQVQFVKPLKFAVWQKR